MMLIETLRASRAAKEVIDGRDPHRQQSEILVTVEHTVAALLLACMGDARKAAAMLNEGLVPGIEQRLSFYAAKGDGR